MPMPEASMHKDRGAVPAQHNVGFTRKRLVMKPKAITQPMHG
jgi:hypothetical protein